ncbi:MAG: TnsD family transposase [Paenibacillus sp.]|nr:TnsD family transposase [Paenibacillus sp.]
MRVLQHDNIQDWVIKVYKMRLYPDELVYSFCSRIHFYSGNQIVRKTTNRLFGNAEKTIHILWPTRLDYFSNNCQLGLSTSELVTKHTLFPYYTKFLSKEKSNKIFEAIVYGISRSNPSAYLGLNQNNVSRLHLCPLCAKEDISNFGEPYWHRSHHLPGSKVCYKHNVYLLTECPLCNESFANTSNKELNITPMFCNNGHSLEFVIENDNMDLLLIAQENNFLLTSDRNISRQFVFNKFIEYAKVKEYQNVQSTIILYDKLFPDFIKRFPKPFLDLIGITITGDQIKGINRIFWRREKPIHTLYVLLLMIFFGGTSEDFLSQEIRYTPFGEGPWPCLNKLCPEFSKKVIETVELKNTRHFAKPRGLFKCAECGFFYSRLGSDDNHRDIYQYDLILETGEVWDSKFEELISNDIVFLNEMVEELGVGRVFLRLKLKEIFGKFNLTQMRMGTIKQLRRNRIIEIVRSNPGITLTKITKIDPKLIKWMQAYDVDWLRENVRYTRMKISLEDRRNDFLEILQRYPNATKKELKQINPRNYVWLNTHDKNWTVEQLPQRVIRKSEKNLEERREQFLRLLSKHSDASRSELRKLESSNYKWLMLNDNEWLSIRQPPIKTGSNKNKSNTLEHRRKEFLRLRKEYPDLSRGDFQRQNSSNYSWLRTYDSDWFEQQLPPLKERNGMIKPRFTLEERRNQFLGIHQRNPAATPKELRKLCESNYTWLHTHDFLWLKKYQPGIRKNINTQRRKRILNKTLEERRDEFITIRNESPHLSRTGLKNTYQSLYVWLMTNDIDWFLNHLPPIVSGNHKL